jgi:hypothetical protein
VFFRSGVLIGANRGHHIAPWGLDDAEFLPVPDVVMSSLEDSLGVVHGGGDP